MVADVAVVPECFFIETFPKAKYGLNLDTRWSEFPIYKVELKVRKFEKSDSVDVTFVCSDGQVQAHNC